MKASPFFFFFFFLAACVTASWTISPGQDLDTGDQSATGIKTKASLRATAENGRDLSGAFNSVPGAVVAGKHQPCPADLPVAVETVL